MPDSWPLLSIMDIDKFEDKSFHAPCLMRSMVGGGRG